MIRIYNIWGENVEELVNKEMTAGKNSIVFDGSHLTSGIYILTIFLDGNKKVTLQSKNYC